MGIYRRRGLNHQTGHIVCPAHVASYDITRFTLGYMSRNFLRAGEGFLSKVGVERRQGGGWGSQRELLLSQVGNRSQELIGLILPLLDFAFSGWISILVQINPFPYQIRRERITLLCLKALRTPLPTKVQSAFPGRHCPRISINDRAKWSIWFASHKSMSRFESRRLNLSRRSLGPMLNSYHIQKMSVIPERLPPEKQNRTHPFPVIFTTLILTLPGRHHLPLLNSKMKPLREQSSLAVSLQRAYMRSGAKAKHMKTSIQISVSGLQRDGATSKTSHSNSP